jgi:hypothetical protein
LIADLFREATDGASGVALEDGRFLGGVGGDMREVEDHKMQEGGSNGLMDFWIIGPGGRGKAFHFELVIARNNSVLLGIGHGDAAMEHWRAG